jgi:teichuronic acid exporter
MSRSLKDKTIGALLWSSVDGIGLTGLELAIQIILARLLLPADFGLMAMLAAFILIAGLLVDSGFGQALIQKKNVDHIDESSVFYFNVTIGAAAAFLLCWTAPWVAGFYEEWSLEPLIRLFAITLVINSFCSVHIAILTKKLDFKTQSIIGLASILPSGVIAIIMAFNGFGILSLVAQQLARAFFRAVFIWGFVKWRPGPTLSLRALRGMFGFGSRLLVAAILRTLYQNVYVLVIGKVFSHADLGYLQKAKRFEQTPNTALTKTAAHVTFPVFSSIQDDPVRLKRGARKVLRTTVCFSMPLMVGIIVVAEPMILLLITDKWLPCIPYLQLLCVAGIVVPLESLHGSLMKAMGRSDLFLRLEAIIRILMIASVIIAYRWGIMAIVYGHVSMTFIAFCLNGYYAGRLITYTLKEQLLDLAPYLAMAVAMGLGAYSVRLLPWPNTLSLLTVQVLAGVFIYIALCWNLKLSAFIEMKDVSLVKLKELLSTLGIQLVKG